MLLGSWDSRRVRSHAECAAQTVDNRPEPVDVAPPSLGYEFTSISRMQINMNTTDVNFVDVAYLSAIRDRSVTSIERRLLSAKQHHSVFLGRRYPDKQSSAL